MDDRLDQDPMVPSSWSIMVPGLLSHRSDGSSAPKDLREFLKERGKSRGKENEEELVLAFLFCFNDANRAINYAREVGKSKRRTGRRWNWNTLFPSPDHPKSQILSKVSNKGQKIERPRHAPLNHRLLLPWRRSERQNLRGSNMQPGSISRIVRADREIVQADRYCRNYRPDNSPEGSASSRSAVLLLSNGAHDFQLPGWLRPARTQRRLPKFRNRFNIPRKWGQILETATFSSTFISQFSFAWRKLTSDWLGNLSGLGLTGTLGYQLSSLASVTYFDLSRNNLHGDIPYQLPPSAVHINLAGNTFTGRVPYSISEMSDLETLILANNQLSGQASDMFGKLRKLYELPSVAGVLIGIDITLPLKKAWIGLQCPGYW
ncbi:Protein STRUBBELIG-RECEPTOR FAMILY 4 [Dendrobium catenatum]|uniref:Protein STRUBBELIG-RECEPTOR FAMILY 4 n=1 Tax=Dendrobium catenatum TaxID=906689 RepID=A0A2I0V8X9_9ASPA|nr:Protein STRUBBELIG-RECEPTOR FAMILY 4 [Dendrobium catenatum]